MTTRQADAIAERIASRVKDLWLNGAFDQKMNMVELAAEIRQELPAGSKPRRRPATLAEAIEEGRRNYRRVTGQQNTMNAKSKGDSAA